MEDRIMFAKSLFSAALIAVLMIAGWNAPDYSNIASKATNLASPTCCAKHSYCCSEKRSCCSNESSIRMET